MVELGASNEISESDITIGSDLVAERCLLCAGADGSVKPSPETLSSDGISETILAGEVCDADRLVR